MPNKYKAITISGTVDGSGFTAYSDVVRGKVLAVEVNYPSNSCTVDLTAEGEVDEKILDLAAASTDKVVRPRAIVQDNTETDVTYDGSNEIYEPYTVYGRLKLEVASGTSGDEVMVRVLLESY